MSEKSESKRDGAKLQPNSGRGQYSKGDATLGPFVIDYKEAAKSFALNLKRWAKVCTDTMAVDRSKHPMLRITLGEDQQKVRLDIIERSMTADLLEKSRRYDILMEQLRAYPEIYDTMQEYFNGG